MIMRVLVGDPGQTTGWVTAMLDSRYAEQGTHVMVKRGFIKCGQIGGGTTVDSECEQAVQFMKLARAWDVTRMVLESFILFPDQHHGTDPNALAPVRMIARIEMVNHIIGLPVSFQSPSEKAIITDDRLRRWGLWQPGKPHANDAIRHLCVFARKWAP